MTQRHPEVAETLRGRFLGLAAPAVIEHLHRLGVTAVELLPVQQAGLDDHLAQLGLPNYWGYSTLGFFAPDSRFASAGDPIAEFRSMVAALHDADIEVLMDVVFNHTPEGGPLGTTLSLRGIDNASYYRLNPDDPAQYEDVTGCGNSLDTSHPRVLQLVLDSLRHWAVEMGVDGFRFDLAVALGRDPSSFDGQGRFFQLIRQDPVLSQLKMVAEPWDLGAEGYRLGGFPVGWSEWNDRFRDAVRRFWRGDAGQLPELAGRITGSRDLFAPSGRGASASINYVCAHDGFTLRDLVSYAHKHNEANGEEGRDGHHDESHNWGVEGPTDDRRVMRMRERARRNFAAMLAVAHGSPMWLAGDELGRTQGGNNNAYCQDNETSWSDWELDADGRDYLEFVRRCFAVRRDNAVFRRRRHLDGAASDRAAWLRPDGKPMEVEDWSDPEQRCVAMLLDAATADPVDEEGRPQQARTALLLLNGDWRTHRFLLPRGGSDGGRWRETLHTACDQNEPRVPQGSLQLGVAPHSLVLLEWEPGQ
jgi:glycogen operon protein